jgi:hypothetical protein
MNRQNVGRSVDQGRIDRAKAQQAVLNELRKGNVITGAQPANPIIGGLQTLFGGAGKGAIPPLGAARLKGEEVLINRGGWDTRRAGSGPVIVGGQTFYPAQSGQDLVYKRAPGLVGGQYGSLFSSSSKADIENREYKNEKSRISQLTAQNPELQRYEAARLKAVAAGPGSAAEQSAEDIGMQMWAKANPTLAAKVKPGQAGYEAIQRMQNVGTMGSPLNLPFAPSSFLGTTPVIPSASYGDSKVSKEVGFSALPKNAFAGASATPYAGFNQGPTLQSAPLGIPSEMFNATYEGVTGIQPIGSTLEQFDPKGIEAQKLLELFKDSVFTKQK